MPIKQSAKKYLRASKKRAVQNLKLKKAWKAAIKKSQELLKSGKADEAKKMMPSVQQILDKAAKSNVITKNTAARKKSRLVKMIKKSSK